MRVLVLDISSSTGWAVFEGEKGSKPTLGKYGNFTNPKTTKEYGDYPFSFIRATRWMVDRFHSLIRDCSPDAIVIEETNKGQNRYSQKYLEFMHCMFLNDLLYTDDMLLNKVAGNIFYVSTSDWRKNQNCHLSKEDKKQNAKLARAKRSGKSKKEVGIAGKITPKHVAVRHANEQYELSLLQKDNDIADAICIGLAFFNNVPLATGE